MIFSLLNEEESRENVLEIIKKNKYWSIWVYWKLWSLRWYYLYERFMCILTYLEEGVKHDQMLKTYGYSLINSIILDFYIYNQYLSLFYKILRTPP